MTEQTERLAELRAQIEATEDEAELSAEQLAQAGSQLSVVLDAVRAADEAVRRSLDAVSDAAQQLAVAAQQLEEQRRLAGGRAAERYKDGNDFSLQALLTADNTGEVLDRGGYLEVVGREDRRTTEELEAARLRFEAEQQALQAEEASLRRVQEQQRGILAEVERLRGERALLAAADADQLRELQADELHLAISRRWKRSRSSLLVRPSRHPVRRPAAQTDGAGRFAGRSPASTASAGAGCMPALTSPPRMGRPSMRRGRDASPLPAYREATAI